VSQLAAAMVRIIAAAASVPDLLIVPVSVLGLCID
jgi:hypothetical protein